MRIAFLITAYCEPEHLRRLADALKHPDCHTFIHVDRKSTMSLDGVQGRSDVTLLPDRINVQWGGWSHVKAELALMRAAMARGEFDYFAMISGTDYPLRSVDALREYLASSGMEHINHVPMPCAELGKPITRLTRFYVAQGKGERPGPLRRIYIDVAKRVAARLPDRDLRKGLNGSVPFGGSTWWVLSRKAVEFVLRTIDGNSRVVAFLRRGMIPDEMLFQTILANSEFRPRMARALTYDDWSRKLSGPETIGHAHLARLADPDFMLDDGYGKGPCFFVRKFSSADPTVLEAFEAIRAAKG